MSDCIEWTGAVNDNGYGVRWFDGKSMSAHRAAWLEQRGPIPDGIETHHVCGTRLCVNAEHLLLMTMSYRGDG